MNRLSTDSAADTIYEGRLFSVQKVVRTDSQGRALHREVVRHPGAVLIIPVLENGDLVMIRNYRVAVGQTLWEFPAGTLGKGEDPKAAALRELEEETGYRSKKATRLGEFYTSPGFADELMHVFAAEQLTFHAQKLEPGEEIETATVSMKDAVEMVRDGRMQDGKTIAGLWMWKLRH